MCQLVVFQKGMDSWPAQPACTAASRLSPDEYNGLFIHNGMGLPWINLGGAYPKKPESIHFCHPQTISIRNAKNPYLSMIPNTGFQHIFKFRFARAVNLQTTIFSTGHISAKHAWTGLSAAVAEAGLIQNSSNKALSYSAYVVFLPI